MPIPLAPGRLAYIQLPKDWKPQELKKLISILNLRWVWMARSREEFRNSGYGPSSSAVKSRKPGERLSSVDVPSSGFHTRC